MFTFAHGAEKATFSIHRSIRGIVVKFLPTIGRIRTIPKRNEFREFTRPSVGTFRNRYTFEQISELFEPLHDAP